MLRFYTIIKDTDDLDDLFRLYRVQIIFLRCSQFIVQWLDFLPDSHG